ncbi:MAG TPA: hypothetical protein VK473_15560 [Terriglobales bacterium]|nr:hypothetical protein [Terriglobales bacterium]
MTVRRIKTYTGETGYVYQYYFVGQRPALAGDSEAPATEYIFDISSDRKTTYAVSVFLRRDAAERWSANHNRTLTEAEQYAVVKIRLFHGFDEIENMMHDGRRLTVTANEIEEYLHTLGVD